MPLSSHLWELNALYTIIIIIMMIESTGLLVIMADGVLPIASSWNQKEHLLNTIANCSYCQWCSKQKNIGQAIQTSQNGIIMC